MHVRRLLNRSLFLFAALLLGGCALLDQPPDPSRPAELEMRGRIAYRHAEQGGSAVIAWRHAPDFDDLLVTGPLGQGIARLDRQGTVWVLTTIDGRRFRAGDAETLTESALGWRLPLAGLVDWVQGRPGPAHPAQTERDDAGRPVRIRQDGWQIEYLAWQGDLPSRLNLHRDADEAHAALDLRLVVDQFTRAAAAGADRP